jgi:hypothetical protein
MSLDSSGALTQLCRQNNRCPIEVNKQAPGTKEIQSLSNRVQANRTMCLSLWPMHDLSNAICESSSLSPHTPRDAVDVHVIYMSHRRS